MNKRLPLAETSEAPHSIGRVHLADSAVETLVGHIRALMDLRNLGVGDALPSERELAEMFSSSRNTVREAMRILKAYGLVDVRPKVGAVIIDRRMDAVFDLYSFNAVELSQKTFLDTQSFRQLIEVGSMDTLFERATPDDIAQLREINDAMFAEDTIEKASRHDFGFHFRLVSITDNQQVMNTYRMMKPVIVRIMESGVNIRKFGETNHREHAAIVDALEGRDRLTYRYLTTMHLEAGLALFKEADEKSEIRQPAG